MVNVKELKVFIKYVHSERELKLKKNDLFLSFKIFKTIKILFPICVNKMSIKKHL